MTAVGETQIVDIRKHTRDSDGEMPRLLELGSPRFGTVEQIGDYHFRYSAPSEGGLDVFLYRIADGAGAKNENWVLAKVADAPNRLATLHYGVEYIRPFRLRVSGAEGLPHQDTGKDR